MSDLISVKSELVRDHLVGDLVGEAYRRYPGKLPDALDRQIAGALAELVEERELSLPDEGEAVPEKLARLGYLGRLIEWERFEPARAPIPWLAARLEGATEDGGSQAPAVERELALSLELARAEPVERPDPASEVGSWRVPGPGGHVRHYVAMEEVERELPGRPRAGGSAARGMLKRGWMLGFFARCCEESAPPEWRASPAPRR